MSAWPVLWAVTLPCGCTFEIWRHEPYLGRLRCGIPDHEQGASDWQPLTDVLIPVEAAPDNARAMHLLREYAEGEWALEGAAQVSVLGPHWYVQDPQTGWWDRQIGRALGDAEQASFYRGQVKQAGA